MQLMGKRPLTAAYVSDEVMEEVWRCLRPPLLGRSENLPFLQLTGDRDRSSEAGSRRTQKCHSEDQGYSRKQPFAETVGKRAYPARGVVDLFLVLSREPRHRARAARRQAGGGIESSEAARHRTSRHRLISFG
jgi:hypothetical protein